MQKGEARSLLALSDARSHVELQNGSIYILLFLLHLFSGIFLFKKVQRQNSPPQLFGYPVVPFILGTGRFHCSDCFAIVTILNWFTVFSRGDQLVHFSIILNSWIQTYCCVSAIRNELPCLWPGSFPRWPRPTDVTRMVSGSSPAVCSLDAACTSLAPDLDSAPLLGSLFLSLDGKTIFQHQNLSIRGVCCHCFVLCF